MYIKALIMRAIITSPITELTSPKVINAESRSAV